MYEFYAVIGCTIYIDLVGSDGPNVCVHQGYAYTESYSGAKLYTIV